MLSPRSYIFLYTTYYDNLLFSKFFQITDRSGGVRISERFQEEEKRQQSFPIYTPFDAFAECIGEEIN